MGPVWNLLEGYDEGDEGVVLHQARLPLPSAGGVVLLQRTHGLSDLTDRPSGWEGRNDTQITGHDFLGQVTAGESTNLALLHTDNWQPRRRVASSLGSDSTWVRGFVLSFNLSLVLRLLRRKSEDEATSV